MKVLVACEYSGRVRDAFRKRGAFAMSCDLLPSDTPGPHYQGDVLDLLTGEDPQWDLIVAFPPCTDLAASGAAYWKEKQADGRQRSAFEFVVDLWESGAARVAIENPVGWLNTNWRKPDQIIQPYHFGDPWMKRTCLWLRGLPALTPTDVVEPKGHWVDGGSMTSKGWSRKTREGSYEGAVSKGNKDRAHNRSATFMGIADAMAEQWSSAA